MLDSCTIAQERWGGVHKLIDRWLAERKQLVQQYTELCEAAEANKTTATLLESFCDILVDYVSAGHFEVYEQLIREAEEFQDQGGLDLARQLYPRIETITQSAVQFNDQYARKAMEKLTRQHTKLQEKLAEAEDKRVEKQHTGADRKAIEKSEQKIASLKQGLSELQEARNAADTYTRQLQSDVRQTLRIAKGLERIESQSDLAIEKRNNPKPEDKPASRPRKPRNRKPAASKPTGENEKPRAEADGNV